MYAMVAGLIYFVGIVGVLDTKGIYRDMESRQAEFRMYEANDLIRHVDDSLNLCYNLGFIPYPLNYYIGEEAYRLMNR